MKHKTAFAVCTAVLGTAVFCAVFYASGVGCPIKFLTGISCAGCGMTRVLISAVCLDFSSAFEYHPLWIVLPPTALSALILAAKRKKKAVFAVICLFALALLCVYVYRLTASDGSVVVFEPKNGLIYRLIFQRA